MSTEGRGRSKEREESDEGGRAAARSRSRSRETFDETPTITRLNKNFEEGAEDRLNGNFREYQTFWERHFAPDGIFYANCEAKARSHNFHEATIGGIGDVIVYTLHEGFVKTLEKDLGKMYGERNVTVKFTRYTTINEHRFEGAFTHNLGPPELFVKVTWGKSDE